MKRFRSILVVPVSTDRSVPPDALREALTLAETSGAELRILGHLPDPPACETNASIPAQALLREAEARAYEKRLTGWVESVGAPALEIDISSGSQPQEVARRVVANGHDLVVIAGDETDENPAVASRILRTCPCPVWLLRPKFRGTRVVAAVDPDHPFELNRLILELAASQAALHDGQLHVMHAWNFPDIAVIRDAGLGLDRDELAQLTMAVEAAHRGPFGDLVRELELAVEPQTHLVDGPAARAVHGLAVLYGADLVVVGAGSWDEPQLGLGSTTEQVLAEIESSVLVVRPNPST